MKRAKQAAIPATVVGIVAAMVASNQDKAWEVVDHSLSITERLFASSYGPIVMIGLLIVCLVLLIAVLIWRGVIVPLLSHLLQVRDGVVGMQTNLGGINKTLEKMDKRFEAGDEQFKELRLDNAVIKADIASIKVKVGI